MMWLGLVFDNVDSQVPVLLADAVKRASSDHSGMHFLVKELYGFHPLRVALNGCVWWDM